MIPRRISTPIGELETGTGSNWDLVELGPTLGKPAQRLRIRLSVTPAPITPKPRAKPEPTIEADRHAVKPHNRPPVDMPSPERGTRGTQTEYGPVMPTPRLEGDIRVTLWCAKIPAFAERYTATNRR